MRSPPLCYERPQLRSSARHLDFKIARKRHFLRQADQERYRQRHAAERRILHDDGDLGGIGHTLEVLKDALFIRPQRGAVIGRHQHEHACTGLGSGARPGSRDLRAEMAACDDHRHTASHVRKAQLDERAPLFVRKEELLRVVGQDANAVDALVDHAIEHAALTFEVKFTRLGEGRRGNGKNAAQRLGNSLHLNCSSSL